MSCQLDDTDLRIIKSMSEDCRKSTTQIAKEVGISRPTTIARLKSLSENRIIDFGAKVNVMSLGFKLTLITFETANAEAKQDIVARLLACPRILQLFQAIGANASTYTALICAENAETMLSTIECVRSTLNATTASWLRVKPLIGKTSDLKIFLEKCELTPCGKKCGSCYNYKELECVGCPATSDYKGPL